MPSKDQHTVVIPPDVWGEIEKRMSARYGGASATIATMLRRYVALLAESRSRNRDTFTPDELMFLRDELKDAHAQAPWVQCEDLGGYSDGKHQLECYRDGTGDNEEWLTADRAVIVRYYAPLQVVFEEVNA